MDTAPPFNGAAARPISAEIVLNNERHCVIEWKAPLAQGNCGWGAGLGRAQE
jgi:hypothetical protein